MKIQTALLLLTLSGLSLFAQDRVQNESFELYNEEIQLLGQLDLPVDSDTFEVVVYVHGSGNIDRDGNQGQFIQPAYIKQATEDLERFFETPVSVSANSLGKGQLKIGFDSQEKLQHILNQIKSGK